MLDVLKKDETERVQVIAGVVWVIMAGWTQTFVAFVSDTVVCAKMGEK